MTPRRRLLDRSTLYLFSYDTELNEEREEIGYVPGGARLNLFARPESSAVYHVARAANVAGLGSPAISGMLESGGDVVFLRDDDVASSEIQVTIRTDDGAVIHMSYRVMGYLGPGGQGRILRAEKRNRIGTEDAPFEAPIITSPRFQTASPRYAWLNRYQCIGFGRVRIINNKFRRLTADVYALT
jgi:hypothetical protein